MVSKSTVDIQMSSTLEVAIQSKLFFKALHTVATVHTGEYDVKVKEFSL